jgi:hypothetical protein
MLQKLCLRILITAGVAELMMMLDTVLIRNFGRAFPFMAACFAGMLLADRNL